MASIKRSKNLVKINNSNNKLNSFNKNNSNQSENTNSKEDNNSNYIEKSILAELLKCDICNNLFDLNTHIPMVAKCGHTFCKKCILEKNFASKHPNEYEACPLDNIPNIFNIELFAINLRIELILKKIFNISPIPINSQPPQQNLNQKQIVYVKKTRTSANNNNQNNNNLNTHSPMNNKNGEYGYKRLDTNSNNSNQKAVKNNELNEGLTTPQIEEEINLNNENKFLFEDEKVNGVIINETIDTIPIYEEKSFCNVSFKEDVNELFAKNISNKKQVENIKKETNKNKYVTNINSKKKTKKKNIELEDNQKDKFIKPITNFSLTPNKNKDNQFWPPIENDRNTINTDRDYKEINNDHKLINKNILLEKNKLKEPIIREKNDLTKYKNNTHQITTVYDKIQLKLNEPKDENFNFNYDYDFIEQKNLNENIMKNGDDLINSNKSTKNSKKSNNIVVIKKTRNKNNNKNQKDLYLNTQYFPSKKIILFSNSTTTNKNSNININRLSTNPNIENNDKMLKKSLILNKKANILSTQILKKSNNNTIEAKNDVNLEELIKSSNKKTTRNDRNNFDSGDNENELLMKNRTYNSKKNDSIHNSLIDNLMNHSNNEYQNKNDELNKNIKILNKSNNNSSSYSNSNSNSVYNKKKIGELDGTHGKNKEDISPLKQIISVTQKESNNIFKKINKNSKSQILFPNNDSDKNLKDLRNEEKDNKLKLKTNENRKNNFATFHSTIIVKKPKNTSPIIFSTKHNNKNRIKIDMNFNTLNKINDKENNNNELNDKNIRRANSFITNNKALTSQNNNNSQNISSNPLVENNYKTISKITKEEIVQALKIELIKIIKEIKSKNENVNEKKYQEMLETIINDPKYENILENIKIRYFDNKDFFIGIMDEKNKYPLKGVLWSHHGDYYNGEFSEGKKDGNGSIVYKNGTRYEGSFKNDRHNGYGKLIQLDGEIFKGEWKNGKINGNGIRLHSNGDKYIGSYVNNIRNGQGHYIFINGDSYNGNWVNGKANGIGTFKFRNGNIYEGEFKDNIILGKGILTMQNGDVYIGLFTNGFINGKGTFISNKGEKYVGNFEGNKKNGEGKLFDKNGNLIKEGIWKKDIFIGDK